MGSTLSVRSALDARQTTETWIAVEDVAAHLGVPKDSIYRWIERRGLPAQRGGQHVA